MKAYLNLLLDLQQQAQSQGHRQAVVLRGEREWQVAVTAKATAHWRDKPSFALGNEPFSVTKQVAINRGHQLLGQECQLLIVELDERFDANSFNAACGTLAAGGLVILLERFSSTHNLAQQWLLQHLARVPILDQQRGFLPSVDFQAKVDSQDDFFELALKSQQSAVENVVKLALGRAQRPLVLTADRGRGKSSALGMACAHLMAQRPISIVVTAPTPQAVTPVFQHAQALLGELAIRSKWQLSFQQSQLQFIAPDNVIETLPPCDLLLVDEAAAIPQRLLQNMATAYSRVVFSTTVHGYEGCGRGFSLKFVPWLRKTHAQVRLQHLALPMRWRQGDPLEQWLNDTFLLSDEWGALQSTVLDFSALSLKRCDKRDWLQDAQSLQSGFALLVQAHYQTSPNDLMQLLSEPEIELWLAYCGSTMIGAVMTVEEGPIDSQLASEIALGRRRPKGALTPVMLIGQVNALNAASLRALRVMRIALSPELQNRGLGQGVIQLLQQQSAGQYDYVSTCFGATDELVSFWLQCGFVPVRLGLSRDAASGTYSLLMLNAREFDHESWIADLASAFQFEFSQSLGSQFRSLESSLVTRLLKQNSVGVTWTPSAVQLQRIRGLLANFAHGGSSMENVLVWLRYALLHSPQYLDEFLVALILQQQSITEIASRFGLPGRRGVEQHLREQIRIRLEDTQFTL
ncbi:tRNA(Met) cytidine acetyltransferase [Vibrio sp. SM6]|uniref:tRNA(Met) cytidine acetyltransferase TmcA n=1 Tax=Vibrio agarilyticus TaxID=2726741 RepID=A0A7X8TNU1_9VIBR|nr:GNAT family N-acetyltransferase [Vibrio agarilyticus]NLS11927.1 tRNA(Met) cytidine acetyltransferase [Vibrio agarilyticus]